MLDPAPDSLDHHFRLIQTHRHWRLEIDLIAWDGQTPIPNWTPFRQWKRKPSENQLARARRSALNDLRYFRTCAYCKELCTLGQMHYENNACHGCAEHVFGYIH